MRSQGPIFCLRVPAREDLVIREEPPSQHVNIETVREHIKSCVVFVKVDAVEPASKSRSGVDELLANGTPVFPRDQSETRPPIALDIVFDIEVIGRVFQLFVLLGELLRVNAFGWITIQIESIDNRLCFEFGIFSERFDVDRINPVSAADDHQLFAARWRRAGIGNADFDICGCLHTRCLIKLCCQSCFLLQ